MTRNIASAIEKLKEGINVALGPDLIMEACHRAHYVWRDRKLGPIATVWMFAFQVLLDTACSHAVRLLPKLSVTDSGYCQARKRIPLRVFEHLFRLVTERLLRAGDAGVERWRGHRVFGVDGSSVSMPHTRELDAAFGHPVGQKKGCSFPVASLVSLFNLRSGLMVDMVLSRVYTSELRAAEALLERLQRGDVLVADRAYSSYVLLHLLMQRGVHIVTRNHQSRKLDLRGARRLGKNDWLCRFTKPRNRPKWLDVESYRSLPDSLAVRVISIRIEKRGHRTQDIHIVTTLLDPTAYPAEEVPQLYRDRWEVETCYRHLKGTLHADVLRCKTESGVRKEMLMHCIVYNLVRAIMVQAALERSVAPDRISFVAVLRYLAAGCIDLDNLPSFPLNPRRPGRHRPRAVKRRPKQYPLLTGRSGSRGRKPAAVADL